MGLPPADAMYGVPTAIYDPPDVRAFAVVVGLLWLYACLLLTYGVSHSIIQLYPMNWQGATIWTDD